MILMLGETAIQLNSVEGRQAVVLVIAAMGL